jgi:hypothetical protein
MFRRKDNALLDALASALASCHLGTLASILASALASASHEAHIGRGRWSWSERAKQRREACVHCWNRLVAGKEEAWRESNLEF